MRGTAGEKPTLKEKHEFKFRTPRIKVKYTYPNNALEVSGVVVPLNPFMLVLFDQFIDQQEVLNAISLQRKGAKVPTQLVLLSDVQEIREDLTKLKNYQAIGEFDKVVNNSTNEGKWVAFRSSEVFNYGEELNFKLGPNVSIISLYLHTKFSC